MRPERRVAAGAVAAPALFAGYRLALVAIAPARFTEVAETGLAATVGLAAVGGLAVGARAAGAGLAPLWAAAGLAWLPLYVGSGPTTVRPGYVVLVFLVVAGLSAAEVVVRHPGRPRRALAVAPLASRSSRCSDLAHDVRLGLAVGGLHLALAAAAWLVARRPLPVPFWFLIWIVSAVGLVVTGAIPVVAYRRRRLRLPAVVLAGWAGWGAIGLWRLRDSLPFTPFQAIRWSGVPPYPDYAVSWATLLVVLVAVAWVERAIRETVGRDRR